MRVLSLFDGISCGRVALERAGIPVSRYVAYEIEKNAIICSDWNWPEIEHRGSVVGADFTEFEGFDIVMGGFPCTDLSVAKRDRKGLEGQHSGLFWELVRAIREAKPRYFLVENNHSMPKADRAIITETLGVEPIMINSALVSAQTRKRLYWTNIPGVEQPEDRGICLRDIIEPNTGKLLSGRTASLPRNVKRIRGGTDKSVCATATMYKGAGANGMTLLRDGGGVRCVTPLEVERLQTLPEGYTEVLSNTQRYKTLGNGWTVDVIAHIVTGAALRTRDTESGRRKKLEVNHTGKANALTTVESDSVICSTAPKCVNLGGKQPSQHARVYSVDAKSPCVTGAHRPSVAVPTLADHTMRDGERIYSVADGAVIIEGVQGGGGGFTKSTYPTASTLFANSRPPSARDCKPCPTDIRR